MPGKGGSNMRRVINVFAGYQFESDYFNRSELDDAIVWACDTAAGDISKQYEIDLKYTPVDITPGNILIEGLKSLIKASEICIFEASDLNNNVFIELGLALAFDKPIIILVKSSALDKIKLPADIAGMVYLEYPDIGKLKAKLSKVLYHVTLKVLLSDKASPYQDILRHLWMGYSQTDVVIIGGEMTHVQSPSNVDGIYYVQSEDVKALVESSINVALLNKDIKINITSSSHIRGEDLMRNIISIGGPRSNTVTRRILEKLSLPWNFEFENIRGSKKKFIIDKDSRKKLEAEIEGACVKSEYCMVVSGPNPFNPHTKFTLFAGLYTFGVLGGVRAVSPGIITPNVLHNINTIIEKKWSGREIIQIVSKVDVINGNVVTPLLNPENLKVLKHE